MVNEMIADGRHDFDFLLGNWHIHNRRLRRRLENSQEWEEFRGSASVKPILGGLGNFDEGLFEFPAGKLAGVTLRLFNTTTQEWSLYWADSRGGGLFAPMIGKFKEGRGEFYAQEKHENQTVLSRFIWSGIAANQCHWEQALSEEGGKSWETNGTRDFTQISA